MVGRIHVASNVHHISTRNDAPFVLRRAIQKEIVAQDRSQNLIPKVVFTPLILTQLSLPPSTQSKLHDAKYNKWDKLATELDEKLDIEEVSNDYQEL